MPSTITTPVAFRLPNNVLDIVKRRAKKRGLRVSEYLKAFLTYDARRKR